MFLNILTVGCGGFIGAALRYLVSVLCSKSDFFASFPLGTFAANFIGCFLMGFLAFWLPQRFQEGSRLVLFATTGCLGGFTTFSTFALDSYKLLAVGQYGMAVAYILASLFFCALGLLAGVALFRAVSA